MSFKSTFEDACRKHKLLPVHKETTPDGEILVADSLVLQSNGSYMTMWALKRDGGEIGRPAFYEPGGYNDDQGARIRHAVKEAEAWIALARSTGFYNA